MARTIAEQQATSSGELGLRIAVVNAPIADWQHCSAASVVTLSAPTPHELANVAAGAVGVGGSSALASCVGIGPCAVSAVTIGAFSQANAPTNVTFAAALSASIRVRAFMTRSTEGDAS